MTMQAVDNTVEISKAKSIIISIKQRLSSQSKSEIQTLVSSIAVHHLSLATPPIRSPQGESFVHSLLVAR